MPRTGWIATAALGLVAGLLPAGAASCTGMDPMPEGSGHDHADPAQHVFGCGVTLVASRDLAKEIPEPTQFGEIDVAGDLLVMATPFPRAGVVVFDVKDPRNPVFRSWFRSTECELETDVDCGADVKLHPSKPIAFLAVQRSSRSRRPPDERMPAGIAVLDLTDPTKPRQVSFTPLPPVGPHLVAYHQIGGAEYLFARIRVVGRGDGPLPPDADPAVGPGFGIWRLEGTHLVPVTQIRTQDSHDVALYDDAVDGRTYLAVSGGRSSKLYLYDVTDPAKPGPLGTWTPPDDGTDQGWYIHDATMFRRDGRRFVVLGAEQFKAEPFHGDAPGTLWMLDATSLASPRMIGKWQNPGRHHAGELVMSTHTSSYIDGFTWTAHYHGGVWLLDWRNVLEGAGDRPFEAGFYVPHEARRAFVVNAKAQRPFISAPALRVRPLVWDAVHAGGYTYVSDINGGLVVLRAPATPKPPPPRRGFPVGVVAAVGGGVLAAAATLFARRRRVPTPA